MSLQMIFTNQTIIETNLHKFLWSTAQIFTLSNISGTSTLLTLLLRVIYINSYEAPLIFLPLSNIRGTSTPYFYPL